MKLKLFFGIFAVLLLFGLATAAQAAQPIAVPSDTAPGGNSNLASVFGQDDQIDRAGQCYDSDVLQGANAKFIVGEVRLDNVNYSDQCIEQDSKVKEFFCVDNKIKSRVESCPNGCLYKDAPISGGACVKEKLFELISVTSCKKINATSVSFVNKTGTYTYAGFCDGAWAGKYSCASLTAKRFEFNYCRNGCKNGACMPIGSIFRAPIMTRTMDSKTKLPSVLTGKATASAATVLKKRCVDSDVRQGANDKFVSGFVQTESGKFNDTCVADKNVSRPKQNENRLEEFYCAGTKKQSRVVACPTGCKNGACIVRNTTLRNLTASDYTLLTVSAIGGGGIMQVGGNTTACSYAGIAVASSRSDAFRFGSDQTNYAILLIKNLTADRSGACNKYLGYWVYQNASSVWQNVSGSSTNPNVAAVRFYYPGVGSDVSTLISVGMDGNFARPGTFRIGMNPGNTRWLNISIPEIVSENPRAVGKFSQYAAFGSSASGSPSATDLHLYDSPETATTGKIAYLTNEWTLSYFGYAPFYSPRGSYILQSPSASNLVINYASRIGRAFNFSSSASNQTTVNGTVSNYTPNQTNSSSINNVTNNSYVPVLLTNDRLMTGGYIFGTIGSTFCSNLTNNGVGNESFGILGGVNWTTSYQTSSRIENGVNITAYTNSSWPYRDVCLSGREADIYGANLVEYFCVGNSFRIPQYVFCARGCSNGVCIR